jgi:hypothetical protein
MNTLLFQAAGDENLANTAVESGKRSSEELKSDSQDDVIPMKKLKV